MNLLGKIFTVLIFVMSIVFVSLSMMVFATHQQWKTKALQVKKELEVAQLKNQQLESELQAQKTRLTAEVAARAFALTALESQLARVKKELEDQLKELQRLQGDTTTQLAVIATTTKNMEALKNEVEKLRDSTRIAQQDRDKMFQSVVAMTDIIHDAKDKERLLNLRNEQLVAQQAKMKVVLDLNGLTDDMYVSATAPPPPLDGVVLAVSKDDLLEISLGRDDGLREGHRMEVFRGSLYLGKVTIMKVTPNRAVAKLVKEYKQGPIRKDDRVTTKLGKLG